MSKFFKKYEYKILQLVAFGFLGIGVAVLLWFIYLVSINYEQSANFDPLITQTVGVFIGGVVPVFISIATVLLIYITFKSNREEFNKISDSNDFQQFIITFDSMYNSLVKIILNFSEKKIIEYYRTSKIKEIKIIIKEELDNFRKESENDFTLIYGTNTAGDKEIKIDNDIKIDNKIILKIKSRRASYHQSEMQVLTSIILLISKYLEDTPGRITKQNKEFYSLRIKHLLIDNIVCGSIMFHSIYNNELSNYLKKYNLADELDEFIGIVNYENAGNNLSYNIPIRKYFKENAFHR